MNFIIELPKSENQITRILYNNILMIIDKLTKYLYLILYKKASNARQIAWLIINQIIRYYKISETIISDKNKIFINNF